MLKKKITFIVDWYIPYSLASSTRIFPFVRAFEDTNLFEITVYTDSGSIGAEFVKPNFFRSPENSLGFKKRILQEFLLGLELFFKLFFIKSDLVIISSPPFFCSFLAILACFLTGKKYIVDVRDSYPEVYEKAGLINSKSLLFKFLTGVELFCYRKAILISTVSPQMVLNINSRIQEEKCILVRNGFSTKVFKVGVEKFPEFTIVFHGNIGRFQNPDLLLKIIDSMLELEPKVKFIVIGDGPKDRCFRNFNRTNFKFYGRLCNEEVSCLISKCHLGLSFRTDDLISINSTPVKVYEYIGVGIPILITPYESEGAILVEKNNIGYRYSNAMVNEIVNDILLLFNNSTIYNGLVQNVLLKRCEYSREGQSEILLKNTLPLI